MSQRRNKTTKRTQTLNSTVSHFSRFHSKCVCEICTCGNHHCPIHSQNNNNYDTTFKASYKAYDPKRQKPCAFDRPLQYNAYDPSLMRSNYQQDYTTHNLPPVELKKPSTAIEQSQPFYADTEYKNNYTKHQSHLNKSKPRESYVPPPGVFAGYSTYNEDFKKHPYQNNQPYKGNTKDGPDFSAKTGNSIYKDDYLKHNVGLPGKLSHFQQENVHGNPGQAEKESVYRKDFRDHERQKYQKQVCPIIEMPGRPKQLSPGKSHINYDVVSNRWN